jgi:hypothetical protein
MRVCLQILDEVSDPGKCEIVEFKWPFAIELNPKLPQPPEERTYAQAVAQGAIDYAATYPSRVLMSDKFVLPDDPKERPLIAVPAGMGMVSNHRLQSL